MHAYSYTHTFISLTLFVCVGMWFCLYDVAMMFVFDCIDDCNECVIQSEQKLGMKYVRWSSSLGFGNNGNTLLCVSSFWYGLE